MVEGEVGEVEALSQHTSVRLAEGQGYNWVAEMVSDTSEVEGASQHTAHQSVAELQCRRTVWRLAAAAAAAVAVFAAAEVVVLAGILAEVREVHTRIGLEDVEAWMHNAEPCRHAERDRSGQWRFQRYSDWGRGRWLLEGLG